MYAKLASSLAALSSLAQALPNPAAAGSALEARYQQNNTAWCGPVLTAKGKQVSAEWVVPQVSLPSPNNAPTAPMFYQWVGIDGFWDSNCPQALLQVGTSQVWNDTINDFVYDVWMEYYTPINPNSSHVSYPEIKAGDKVRATVVGKDKYSGTVYLENLTNGQYDSWDLSAVGDYPLCYEHVEWVNEAPLYSLPRFPDMEFTSLSYTDFNKKSHNAAGSNLQYLDEPYAVCSSTLSSDGNTASFSQKLPNGIQGKNN